ncbi:nucleotidyltransferase [Paenibacillus sp. GCM10027626]|uniref:nucleotidyltransferase n=1 Tax=Paenibacillus sp. GCM10027626 TaxID=3273411 RepID=UPI003645776C
MRTVGLIVEYNPFHNGHLYHLQQSKKITGSDAVIAVMSGHFLQRGEPALLDKWTRAEMALRGGCDLVIELPVAYSTQAAEWFAYGAVALLEATGVVDCLCFGSEGGMIAPLRRIAKTMAKEPASFGTLLAAALAGGSNYPSAYSSAVKQHMLLSGDDEAAAFPLNEPNNTLGLHYLLALERLESAIQPFTIKREKAGYSQANISDASIASATAIRKLIMEDKMPEAIAPYVPASTFELLMQQAGERRLVGWEQLSRLLFHKIISESAAELNQYHEVTEGLEYRIKRLMPSLPRLTVASLLDSLKTKRYTRTKLQRALLAILLNHHKEQLGAEQLRAGIQYLRILGCSAKGKTLLKKMKGKAALPILLSAARPPEPFPFLELDVRATSIYGMAQNNAAPDALYRDYYAKPIFI